MIMGQGFISKKQEGVKMEKCEYCGQLVDSVYGFHFENDKKQKVVTAMCEECLAQEAIFDGQYQYKMDGWENRGTVVFNS